MKTLLHRLADVLWPWRLITRHGHRIAELEYELRLTTQERDTARKQHQEAVRTNRGNAEIERLTQVQFQRLQAALNEAGLSHLVPIHPSLAASHGLAATYEKQPKRITP